MPTVNRRLSDLVSGSASLDTGDIDTGTFADARISAGNVSQHTGADNISIRQDLTILALREATNESSAAFNLPSSFVDTFTDSTNLTLTDVTRDTGYVSPTFSTPVEYDYNAAATGHNLVRWTNMSSANDAWYEIDTNGDATIGGTKYIIPAIGISGNSYTVHTNGAPAGDNKYFKFDFGISRNFGGKLKIGKHTPSGNVSQYKLLYSADDSSYSAWDMSGISQLGTTEVGTGGSAAGGGVTGGTSAGIITLADYTGGEYTTVNTVEGVSFITARYIKVIVLALGSSGNNNAGVMQFAPFGSTLSAAGTLIQSANTVVSPKTKVAGVMLYKDADGAATLGTDLIVSFTCNGGTNWTDLVAGDMTTVTPVFSTGIKMVKLAEKTCTEGSDVRYKVVWANQGAGKTTQLHGIGLNY